MDDLLARPPLVDAQPSWLDRLLDEVATVFARLLDAAGATLFGQVLGLVLLAVIVGGIVLVVLRVLRRVRRDRAPAAAPGTPDDVGRAADEWRDDATRHAAAGEWRDAVRCGWRAIVADLAAGGLVEEVSGRTAGEYQHAVADSLPAAADDFAAATATFKAAWYSHAEITAADLDALTAAGDRITAARPSADRRGRTAARSGP